MGLFDKIKDNAKTISMKAIEATREYDEDYMQAQQDGTAAQAEVPTAVTYPTEAISPENSDQITEEIKEAVQVPEGEKAVEEPKKAAADTKEEDQKSKKEEKPADTPRRSKITEVPKSEVNKKPKVPYTPSYKMDIKKNEAEKDEPKKPAKAKSSHVSRVIDVTPHKILDPGKQAIYARERAALSALASQRRLNGAVALYSTNHLNFKTRVYINRIEYSGSFGKNVLPIEQVSWVKLRAGGTGVIIETAEGKRVVMVVKPADRLAFADAVLKVQAMQPKKGKIKDTQTVRIDQLEQFGEGVDEIEKLAKLFDKGILTQAEFDAKKKQILGI